MTATHTDSPKGLEVDTFSARLRIAADALLTLADNQDFANETDCPGKVIRIIGVVISILTPIETNRKRVRRPKE